MGDVLTINRTDGCELSLRWNSGEYLTQTAGLSIAQKGRLLTQIDEAALRGDVATLKRFPWIEGWRWVRITGRPRVPSAVRRDVLSAGVCAQCGSTEQLTVDHIRPLAKGGGNDRGNLQCLCWPCNHQKRDRWEES